MKCPLRQSCHGHDKFVYLISKLRDKHAAMFKLSLFITTLLGMTATCAWAKPASEADLIAATETAHEIGLFLQGLPQKPANVAIFDVRVNFPIDPGFASVLEAEVIRTLREEQSTTMTSCFECRAPQIEIRDDKLVVRKGIPDQAAMGRLAKATGADSFMMLNISHTRFSLVTEVTLYQASDGTALGAKQIRIPALDWSEAGLQLILAAGPSSLSGGQSVFGNNTAIPFSAHLAALEEVGFGKAGLVLGGAGGPAGNLAYITPTIAWRNAYGTSGIYSLKSLGGGFGTSNGVGVIAVRADYTLMLGSFTVAGAEAVLLSPAPSQSNTGQPLSFVLSAFIGFNFGR